MAVFLTGGTGFDRNYSVYAETELEPPEISFGATWTGWYMNRYSQYINYKTTPPTLVSLDKQLYWECMIMSSGTLYVGAGKTYTADVWGIGCGQMGDSYAGGSGSTDLVLGMTLSGNVSASITVGNATGTTKLGAQSLNPTSYGSSVGNVNGNSQMRIISRFYDPSKNTEYGRAGSHKDFPAAGALGGGGFMDFGYAGNTHFRNTVGGGYGAGNGYASSTYWYGTTGCILIRIAIG